MNSSREEPLRAHCVSHKAVAACLYHVPGGDGPRPGAALLTHGARSCRGVSYTSEWTEVPTGRRGRSDVTDLRVTVTVVFREVSGGIG